MTPVGGALIATCFFLPWIQISCLGTSTFSGAEIGGIYWTIFGGGVALVIGFFALRWFKRCEYAMSVVAAVSIVCLAVIFYGIFTIAGGKRVLFFRVGPDDVNLKFHIGSFGTILGLVLAWVGALPKALPWRHRKSAVEPILPRPAQPSSGSP